MACRQVLAVWPGQTDACLSPRAHGLSLRQSRPRHRACAPGLPGAARAGASISATSPKCAGRRGCSPRASRRGGGRSRSRPTSRAAWNNLGIVLQETLKLDESRLCLERALALEPNNAETLNNLANTFKRLGLAAEAEKRWTAALALRPDYAEAYSNLSNLLNDQGEYDRAEATARRAIELNPRLADAYINLAAVETARHRHGDACACSTRCSPSRRGMRARSPRER